MRKILFVCSGGMSSAIVVTAFEKEAEKNNLEVDVKAVGIGEVEDEVKDGYELLLVAPQVRHKYDLFKSYADEVNVPTILINPQGYTPLGGPIVFEQVKEALDIE